VNLNTLTNVVTALSFFVGIWCLSLKGTELAGWLLLGIVFVNGLLFLIRIMRRTRGD
jgi:hypothetical protein